MLKVILSYTTERQEFVTFIRGCFYFMDHASHVVYGKHVSWTIEINILNSHCVYWKILYYVQGCIILYHWKARVCLFYQRLFLFYGSCIACREGKTFFMAIKFNILNSHCVYWNLFFIFTVVNMPGKLWLLMMLAYAYAFKHGKEVALRHQSFYVVNACHFEMPLGE